MTAIASVLLALSGSVTPATYSEFCETNFVFFSTASKRFESRVRTKMIGLFRRSCGYTSGRMFTAA
jgi:hypothetical protein